jgi:hypothetical protein
MAIDTPPERQRFGSLKATVKGGPLGRTSLYELASVHPRLFRKFGRKVVVDRQLYGDLLQALPSAKIKKSA